MSKFFRSQTHLWRVVNLFFFDMLSESVNDICMTSPELLANLEIDEFCYWTLKQFFWQTTDKNSEIILDNYPIN